jgi:uncharacterized protein
MPATEWNDSQLEELQLLLDSVPAPLEPLDVSMLDGYLCGVLVQPGAVPASKWLPQVTDIDGRPLPRGFDAVRLHALVMQRHGELDRAIARREWFDPWVFELTDAQASPDAAEPEAGLEAVYPWVAGFAAAMNVCPALMESPAQALVEPLAMLYRHLDPEDLEDADELLDAIAMLEPLQDLAQAVQDLVRATLLLADVGRPLPPAAARSDAPRAARRAVPSRRRPSPKR